MVRAAAALAEAGASTRHHFPKRRDGTFRCSRTSTVPVHSRAEEALFHRMMPARKKRIQSNAMNHQTIILCRCSSDPESLRASTAANRNRLSSTPVWPPPLPAARSSKVFLGIERYIVFEWRLNCRFLLLIMSLPPSELDQNSAVVF